MAEVSKLSAMGFNSGSATIAMILTLLNEQSASMKYISITSLTLPNQLNLGNAKLEHAKFHGTTLMEVNLSGANLEHAAFYDANVTGANLSNANLTMTEWRGSHLTNADISGANLLYADFRQTRVDHANFTDSDIAGANFQNSTISQLQVNQACQRPAGPPPVLPQHLHWQNNICD